MINILNWYKFQCFTYTLYSECIDVSKPSVTARIYSLNIFRNTNGHLKQLENHEWNPYKNINNHSMCLKWIHMALNTNFNKWYTMNTHRTDGQAGRAVFLMASENRTSGLSGPSELLSVYQFIIWIKSICDV